MVFLTYIVVPLVVVTLPILVARHVDRISAQDSYDQDGSLVFKVSGWMFGVLLFMVLLFGVFAVAGFLYANAGKVFFLLLGAFFILIGFFELRRLSKAQITISEESLVYTKGRKETVVALCLVRNVVAANGLIIIDTGTIPRPVLPMYFHNASKILAVLRQHANRGTTT